LALNVIT
jgi:hypothetical protein